MYDLQSQITFSNIDIKLKTVKAVNSTELIATNATFSIKFHLKKRNIQIENNFVLIDSQLIQLAPLKINGYKKGFVDLSINDQKIILEEYSNSEIDYFKNDLNIEVINPNSQWVVAKSRHWIVWYFRVGNIPTQVEEKTKIQLFASTIIGNKVLTINAPILSDSDFTKAGSIVNEMMESLTNNMQH